MDSITIFPSEVFQALASLDPTKAMGPDAIGPRVLKFCSHALFIPIHHLFSISLRSSSLPAEWRLHRITPVFKSGDKSLVKNYRPISLLCTVSKVLERLVYNKIIDFIHPSLSNFQFGFLRGRSSLQQLLLFVKSILMDNHKKCQSDVIYLDLRKAFDSVSHHILLKKLWCFGICGELWLWFKAYLSSRSQYVSINHISSDPLPVLSGVPQGSILGPLLFLIFINDLPQSTSLSELFLFADDTKARHTISTFSDCASLQSYLNSLSDWCTFNQMTFNESKSVLLRFSALPDCDYLYHLNNIPITISSSQKDLGVIISSSLSWSNHYHYVLPKAYKTLGLIRRVFSHSPSVNIRKKLYISLVRSQLLYCSSLWRPHLLKDIQLLEKLQRRATKFILNDYSNLDYKDRLLSLNLLPLSMVFEINDLMFFIRSFLPVSNTCI